METLSLPQHVTAEEIGLHRARIVIEPCYPGYGTTLGNALRRVLLSSLPGAAVTAVKISKVDHEFSTLPGVKEDVVDLLLNIKQIRCKVFSAEPVNVHLKVTGEKDVTAGDIETTSDVEVINKDLHLATLTDKKASLEIVFTVEQGRGYITVETREKEKLDIGTIAVDAIYTPVKRVGYAVENVRVGQMTNYDKLTLDVETDGSINPLEAVKQASTILIDHFMVIKGDDSKATSVVEDSVVEPKVVVEEKVAEDELESRPTPKKRGRPKKEI